MSEVIFDRIDGGRRGYIVASEIVKILHYFALFPIASIQEECNKLLMKYENIWKTRQGTEKMKEYGLEVTYEKGLSELAPPFKLNYPSAIHITILDSFYEVRNIPALTYFPTNDILYPNLIIFLGPLNVNQDVVVWTTSSTSFADAIIHEIFHLCGDVSLADSRIQDGYIRHTLIANEAIKNLSISLNK